MNHDELSLLPASCREILGDMVHDLLTPIGAAMGFAEVLCDPDRNLSEDQRQEFTMEVRRNLERTVELIREFSSQL